MDEIKERKKEKKIKKVNICKKDRKKSLKGTIYIISILFYSNSILILF